MSPVERNSSEIKRDLERRRSELEENLHQIFRGKKARSSSNRLFGSSESIETIGDLGNGVKLPVLAIVAGAALAGLFLLRRRLYLPMRLAGRFVELAAPVVVPAVVRRISGIRASAN
jgi:hypothetical protein